MTDKEFYTALGSVLRNERTKRDLSLLDIAERIGCAKSAVHYWETGEKAMSALYLSKYCDVLGMTIDDVFAKVKKQL